MTGIIWLGTEESLAELDKLEAKYTGPEYMALYDGDGDEPSLDKEFNVMSDRKGLYLLQRIGDVAVLRVHGSLTHAYSRWHAMFPGYATSYEAIKDALAIVANERSITSVYLDFATGGGGVRGLDTAAEMIRKVDAIKPVFGHTDSHAFSAGYWLACTCRKFTGSRMSEVGSIGTLMILSTQVEAAKMAGIKYHVFRAGEFKAVGLPYENLSEEAAIYLQENLEKTNQFFLEHVSRERNLMVSDRASWAEGRTFFAEEGIEVGLVDGVTTLADLIGSAASATITSDQRRFEMPISPEKLAQIAAGADPKTVLTAEELTHYLASIEAPAAAAEESEAGAEADEGGDEPVAQEPAQVSASADVLKMTREVGRLEAKLESAEAKLAEMQTKMDQVTAENTALTAVARVAVRGLQSALGQAKAEKATGTEVVAQFNELNAEMAVRFKTGQTTKLPVAELPQAVGMTSFRHNSPTK